MKKFRYDDFTKTIKIEDPTNEKGYIEALTYRTEYMEYDVAKENITKNNNTLLINIMRIYTIYSMFI